MQNSLVKISFLILFINSLHILSFKLRDTYDVVVGSNEIMNHEMSVVSALIKNTVCPSTTHNSAYYITYFNVTLVSVAALPYCNIILIIICNHYFIPPFQYQVQHNLLENRLLFIKAVH